MATIALALLSAEASALVSTSHNGRFAPALGLRRAGPLLSSTAAALELQRSAESTADAIQRKLARIRELRPTEQSPEVQQKLWESAGLLPMYKVSGSVTGEPSFTQLFSHETWSAYTGKSPFRRWLRTGVTWRHSTVLASVWPICLSLSLWSFCVASLPARFLPRTSPLPLTAMGSAIGLLLVFRVNNLYGRVAEARLLNLREWDQQAAQTVATALLFDRSLPAERAPASHAAASKVCRYLAAFPWELNAKLTGKGDGVGKTRGLRPGEDTDILRVLLPAEEVDFIGQARSRPLLLLGAMRRQLHAQLRDLKELDLVVGGCERVFSSPVPPTMSRHVIRCMLLWLLGLPAVLAGSMSPAHISLWVFLVIMLNLEEALAMPPPAEASEQGGGADE
ncbi:hypothetical protein EMIHUDRAFT_224720 [Emiliania huxleyi CCMP1516]|uniref:Uncharacterized protein n=2 Tax=Emiliania huxleyi TaxID=2903 RepID=A0A0D3KRE7_EMIH1|nr:hypothetical protein EMIHUDRAFT_224720 [Emiliania huxleyi CCMP1516]EOD38332.1 hypothetical protein EMIHUDRAFT_224720 [Emiliania huxleyi CCMP1516]|eukprot:XP_005790761.1 hypothetical protein EMIHUDRAFT_224720 [Emiliania huxleyi CCMP1516]